MGRNNISVVGKELNIFSNKSDMLVKVGAVKLDKKDLKSEVDFIKALQQENGSLDNGVYSVHHDSGLFARFSVQNKQITGLHRLSENTGILMPCWNYFEE